MMITATTVSRSKIPAAARSIAAATTAITDQINTGGNESMRALSAFPAAAIAAIAILAGVAMFVPGRAAAQAAPSAASAGAAPAAKPAAADVVEARIKSLHDQLKITAAEEPQWNAVAQAMRDSAKNTGALIAARAKKAKSMTAIDDLHSYRAILQAHLDSIDKLTNAFEGLYAAMPEAQKKIADAVFSRRPSRAKPKSG
jgi:periplasmic protein CpxP/Spy